MERMRISQLAERAGVPVTTLRFYEAAGLVPAERSAAGYRLYGPEAQRRLDFIGAAKHLGLPLEEIAGMLEVWVHGACTQVKADLRPRLAHRLADAETRRAELTGLIEELRRALAHLETMPDRSEHCDPDCAFPAKTPEPKPQPESAADAASAPGPRLEIAVACSLGAGELAERAAHWHALLADGRRRPTEHGVTVAVPAERAAELAALCVAEQECCPFFTFTLRIEGTVAHLDVGAPPSARQLVEELTA